MFTAGVAVNIPLGHPGDIYALKAAKHKRAEAAYQVEESKNLIRLEVNRLNHQLKVANLKLQQAESDLDNAEENLRLADESFKAGVVSSTDLMAAQTAWMKAKTEVLDAEIELRLDHLYLMQATGESTLTVNG
jgi:outer membrane protein TolC